MRKLVLSGLWIDGKVIELYKKFPNMQASPAYFLDTFVEATSKDALAPNDQKQTSGFQNQKQLFPCVPMSLVLRATTTSHAAYVR